MTTEQMDAIDDAWNEYVRTRPRWRAILDWLRGRRSAWKQGWW